MNAYEAMERCSSLLELIPALETAAMHVGRYGYADERRRIVAHIGELVAEYDELKRKLSEVDV